MKGENEEEAEIEELEDTEEDGEKEEEAEEKEGRKRIMKGRKRQIGPRDSLASQPTQVSNL